MKLECYFHVTASQSTAAHQKHTPIWGAIVSPGCPLSLQIKSVYGADLHEEGFPKVAKS